MGSKLRQTIFGELVPPELYRKPFDCKGLNLSAMDQERPRMPSVTCPSHSRSMPEKSLNIGWTRRWPIANLIYSFLSGAGAFFVLLGSQPASPIALRKLAPGISQWIVPAALFADCVLVPAGCVILVRGYRRENRSFIGLDLSNFPGGRHSLEREFPRRAAIASTLILGFAWFEAKSRFFSSDTWDQYPVRLIQLFGALVLVFALFQWTYRYLFRKTATKAGVSTAPVVGFHTTKAGSPLLVLADGTTREINLIYNPEWRTKVNGDKRIALVLETELREHLLFVTLDGEGFRAVIEERT
jgi:hypothetical protein